MSLSLVFTILHHLRSCLHSIVSFVTGFTRNRHSQPSGLFFPLSTVQSLTFDNGVQVRIGKQIAEGGFSFVFEAVVVSDNGAALWSGDADMHADGKANSRNNTRKSRYALKRINCSDREVLQACRHEAGVHRSLPRHDNLMELLGLKFERDDHFNHSRGNATEEYNVCYMLFPLVEKSLRGEINERHLLQDSRSATFSQRRAFSTKEILAMFAGILDGISTMHQYNISHRDLKIENILLRERPTTYRDERHLSISAASARYTPILMDFGSAGPLSLQLNTRHAALSAIETAAQHTTLSYRPPELFEGGIRHDPMGKDVLDYGRVDVWSLGCVLFGMMHGCSPFEMEFVRTTDHRYDSNHMVDEIRIVECSQLRVLGEVPYPPWASLRNSLEPNVVKDASINGRYPLALYDFVRLMVCHDRRTRPDVKQVRARFCELYLGLVGEPWRDEKGMLGKDMRGEDEFDSLIANREFV
ncbi:hypothetical protein HJC23_006249 [Cyclotella cryptica]|uniref:non-specific serine/threonine protein kinase n=1 Tax=Cyclotella cryptica TaxID=29204 RepID=A0ABD3PN97_9STRA|eukprot:CCRYP_013423-RA/>CCRYP_013423-RA protein AED:0.04 eAED:0.04 QI:0/-1/0/1/-1/1/1/0/471